MLYSNSTDLVVNYHQLMADIHLYLLMKGEIKDEQQIARVDFTYGENSKELLHVWGNNLNFLIDPEDIDTFISKGYEL